jgi:hypothetical protein
MTEKLSVILKGTVDKVIPSSQYETEKVQISVETAHDLYREVRIENTLTDGSGGKVSLIAGSPIKITIKAEAGSMTVIPSVPPSRQSTGTP